MSETAVRISDLPIDDSRGTLGMYLFIASEALVFVYVTGFVQPFGGWGPGPRLGKRSRPPPTDEF